MVVVFLQLDSPLKKAFFHVSRGTYTYSKSVFWNSNYIRVPAGYNLRVTVYAFTKEDKYEEIILYDDIVTNDDSKDDDDDYSIPIKVKLMETREEILQYLRKNDFLRDPDSPSPPSPSQPVNSSSQTCCIV